MLLYCVERPLHAKGEDECSVTTDELVIPTVLVQIMKVRRDLKFLPYSNFYSANV